MSDKPSYLGLLNAISLAEGEAECYLNAWAAVTPDDGVRHVLATVAIREGEHAKAFAKRICELGYSVIPRGDEAKSAEKMALAARRDLSDKEKFERLQGDSTRKESDTDIFSGMFNDKTIDIQTGALLGRYIAEERDSGRLLRSCYGELCARENGGSHGTSGSGDGRTEARLDRIERLLEQLVNQS
jgi:rubrerythrin